MIRFFLELFGIKPRLKVYTYGYQRYPFDDEQRFQLDAENVEAADNKAREIIKCYLQNGWTSMLGVWRIEKRK